MAPGIMLENRKAFDALERSRRLVRGTDTALGDRTWTVLGIVLATFFVTAVVPDIGLALSFGFRPGRWQSVFTAVVATLTAPYSAHILSVIYYRLTDPDRPVIHPGVRRWPSVWEGPA
jgi:hypothetical protein